MALLNRATGGNRRSSSSGSNGFGSNGYGNNGYGNNGYGSSPYRRETTDSSSPMGIPSAFADEIGHSPVKRKSLNRKGGRSWGFYFTVLTILVLAGGYSFLSYHERKMMKAQLEQQESTMRELEIDLSMQFDTKVQKLKDENKELQKKLSDNKEWKIENYNLRENEKSLNRRNDETKVLLEQAQTKAKNLETANQNLINYKKKTQENIQNMSRLSLLAKYGPGPHRVEMHVRFDSHLGRDDGGIITIEMAPVDELPHAVYWFLEQVSKNLYDGTSIFRNPGHILQASLVTNFLTPQDENRDRMYRRFKDAGLTNILFQEYSEKFPHVKYTLGYGGRPGGPDFYISTQDNTRNHGPGGQAGDPTEADTCFAKVVDGFDIVDRMSQLPLHPNKEFKDHVAITSTKIKPN